MEGAYQGAEGLGTPLPFKNILALLDTDCQS